jgi:signal transduction histidine kinase
VATVPAKPLRSRVRIAIVGATAAALVVFAVPLALVVRSEYIQQSETELEREAARVLAIVPDTQILSAKVPKSSDEHIDLAVYSPTGHRVSGEGPEYSALAARAWDQQTAPTLRDGGTLATFLPVKEGANVHAVIRAAIASTTLTARYLRAWALMAVLALVVLLLAWLASGRVARRLSAPLERLASSAEALGKGGFGLQVPRSGVAEVDVVAEVLEQSGQRLGDRFQRERAFSADASHQLRTPMTALRLTLESSQDDPAADVAAVTSAALDQVDRLEHTLEDLLALARDLPGPAEPVSVEPALIALKARYRDYFDDAGRTLDIEIAHGLPLGAFPESALRQVLDVLVDNALRHGSGGVLVTARPSGTGVAVDVRDAGVLPAGDLAWLFERRSKRARGTGIGLALARSLAEADGARLTVAVGEDHSTVFTLLMAEAEPGPAQAATDPERTDAERPGGPSGERSSHPSQEAASAAVPIGTELSPAGNDPPHDTTEPARPPARTSSA